MRIFVTGASGFIGRRIVRRVALSGHTAVALTLDRGWVTPDDRVEVREIDLLAPATLATAVADCAAGIHAAGAGPGALPAEIHALNVTASANLAAACRRTGGNRRLVAISSAAVLETGDTAYRRAKLAQEQVLGAAGLELTVLRPTLVIGPYRDSPELTRLVERLRARRFIVVPGGGRNRIQPVHVDDIADAAVRAVERDAAAGTRLVVAGQEGGIEYRKFLEEARERTGGRAQLVGVPVGLVRVAALLPGIAGRGARARAAFFARDHVYGLAEAANVLGWRPRDQEEALLDVFGSR